MLHLFHYVFTELRLLIDCHLLERVDHTKFLGIIIDSKFTWSDHVQYISPNILNVKEKSLCASLEIFCHLVSYLPFFYTLIQPYLTHCLIIWG